MENYIWTRLGHQKGLEIIFGSVCVMKRSGCFQNIAIQGFLNTAKSKILGRVWKMGLEKYFRTILEGSGIP